MATPTNQEQLFLELINRARLDPAAEAARQGIDLNQGLSAGTITIAQKQPLTFNEYLNDSADAHTAWMLSADVFSHTGSGGSSSFQRMQAAGYVFIGSWMSGENLAWSGSTGAIDANAYVYTLHRNLFLSSGHRTNTMKEGYKEIGVGAAAGQFNSGGTNFNSLMVTQNFATSGTAAFVTGVAYNDTDLNNFYSVGEGQGGITTEVSLNSTVLDSAASWSSGGYSLGATSTGAMKITFSGGGLSATMGATFTLGTTNVKVDLVNGNTIQSSVSATLTDAALNLMLLGINGTSGTGNALVNSIKGNSGANTLSGLGGNDTLDGGTGSDYYIWQSGDGSDTINDTSVSLSETDVLVLTNVASTGVELIKFGSDLRITILATGEVITIKNQFNASTLGDGVEYLSFSNGVNWNLAAITANLAPPPPINGTGNADALVGSSGIDYIYGFAGDDSLNGLAGADVLDGGDGVDTASYAASAAAVIVNFLSGVASGGDAAGDIFAGIENIVGSNFNDTLTGNYGNNRLDGGLGTDKMIGSYGDDTYVVNATRDTVTEVAGQGTDTIETLLAAHSIARLTAIENLSYIGGLNFTGTGNALNNVIRGGIGNDILNGGTGADILFGGVGNDTYVVDNAGDVVDESTGSGADLVQSSVSFNLGDGVHTVGDVENLTLTGRLANNGTGTGLGNSIVGNSGANVIEGKGGGDYLDGGAGLDTVSYASSAQGVMVWLNGATLTNAYGGDAQGDMIKSFENILGSAWADTLTGDGLANVINGGAGGDAMAGGAGNDTYLVDDAGDVITESLSAGTDLVKSSVTHGLGANVENLTLTGSDSINAIGNGLVNTLTGNIGSNRLDGGFGADKMTGGIGDDTYVVDNIKDIVTEVAGQGTDTIETSLATYSLAKLAAIENLTYDNGVAADGNFIGTGNTLANRITGGTGNDTFTGGAGGDTFFFNVAAFGQDKITDYQDNLDKLSFSLSVADSFDDFVFTGNGTKIVTVTQGADSIILTSTVAFTLAADDFIFV
jgi:Ca2+-binding RTX toxin-like protein